MSILTTWKCSLCDYSTHSWDVYTEHTSWCWGKWNKENALAKDVYAHFPPFGKDVKPVEATSRVAVREIAVQEHYVTGGWYTLNELYKLCGKLKDKEDRVD